MAEKKQNNKRSRQTRRSRPARRPVNEGFSLSRWLQQRRDKKQLEFRPDATTATWGKTLRMTQLQRLRLGKWLLYTLTIVLSLVFQDVIMSQVSIFGATTDLAVCAILLITVIEGTEVGSMFVLIASVVYYFSGTAPGAYCIALLTFLGIGTTMFRQMYWHRSKGSVILCAAIAVAGYEMGLFVVGLMTELTIFTRIGSFLLRAAFSCAALLPMYPLIHRIGLIGGNTWKE